LPVEVDVLGRASSVGQPQLQRKPGLQKPPVWRIGGEPGEEAVEGDALALPREACVVARGATKKRTNRC
jgi:hypothetical protein